MVYPHCYRTEHSETRTTNSIYGQYYAKQMSKKIPIQPDLLKLLQFVDTYREDFIKDLREMVAIKSISSDENYQKDVKAMIALTEQWLLRLGIKYECFNLQPCKVRGKLVELPPVILGSIGSAEKTLLVYAHLDVKEPNLKEWKTDPWTVTEIDRVLYGNGVALGKGPLLAWFHAIDGFVRNEQPLPINIKFLIESMHTSGSPGLESFLTTKRQDFLNDISYLVVCESEWLGDKIPCLVYGSVGMLHFRMTAENTKNDPRADVKKIFENIVDEEDNILIPNFNDYVEQIRPDEEKLYESLKDFKIEEYRVNLPEHKKNWDQVKLLMSFWRLPSIWVGPIMECICEKQEMSKVKCDFSVKIVPRQLVKTTCDHILSYIENLCEEMKLGSTVKVEVLSSSRPWCEDFWVHNFKAASRATIQIYKEAPNMIREDRNIHSVKLLKMVLDTNALVIPLGNKSGNAGGANENVSLRNFYEGTKLLAAYIFQLALVGGKENKQ